jgi:GNAT superfamily N-acetyltransferase
MTKDRAALEVRAAQAVDFPNILRLQRENVPAAISQADAHAQGFVTVVHDEAILQKMHALAPSVVAEQDGALAGYALTMPVEARRLLPILEPMFRQLDEIEASGRALCRYYVMGQICVARAFRGSGVFDALYAGHRRLYASRFDRVVTEIAVRNGRSMRAHGRVGFEVIHRYRDATDDWAVVAWDFRAKSSDSSNVGVDLGSDDQGNEDP